MRPRLGLAQTSGLISSRRFYEAIGGQVIGTRETEDYGFSEPQVVYGWEEIQ